MPHASQDGSPKRRSSARALALVAVVVLLVAGIVVTATAAPGPKTDVKTAQYSGTPVKIPTSGPCKGIGGEALSGCEANAKAMYKKAKAKCMKKHGSARTKCLKAAKKKWVG